MTTVGFLLLAGAASLARAEAGQRWNRSGRPAGTFFVNVAGSLLIGVVRDLRPPFSTVIAVGGLGAFTTFSSFARDAIALVEERRFGRALAYVLLTATACVACASLGASLT